MPAKGGEVAELIGHIRATKKFKVVKSGNQKHHKVLTMKGAVVTDANGPLIISGSPGEHRWREMHVQRLMAAGVLQNDPYKATRKTKEEREEKNGNGNGNGEPAKNDLGARQSRDPEFKKRLHEAKVAAIHLKSEKAREATAKLRGRWEPIVPHLGGWSVGGRATSLDQRSRLTVAELAEVAHYWGSSRGRVELPTHTVRGHKPIGPEEMKSVVQTFKTPGSTLGDTWRPFFEVFVDELWQHASNDPRKAAARYMELLREARGLVPAPASPPAGRGRLESDATGTDQRADEEAPPVTREQHGPMHQPTVPSLALKSLFWFAKGGMEEDEALKLSEQIAKHELRGGN